MCFSRSQCVKIIKQLFLRAFSMCKTQIPNPSQQVLSLFSAESSDGHFILNHCDFVYLDKMSWKWKPSILVISACYFHWEEWTLWSCILEHLCIFFLFKAVGAFSCVHTMFCLACETNFIPFGCGRCYYNLWCCCHWVVGNICKLLIAITYLIYDLQIFSVVP